MSKDKISDYSATANSNTDIGGINIDEGCAPSGINDAIRTLMKQLKDWQSGSQDVYIHPAGSASVPSITATGDTNTGIFFPAADTVGITTGGTERARVDSSGNLGLGVTPSAWALSGSQAVQVKNASLAGYLNNAYLSANVYFDSAGASKYIASAAATQYAQNSGAHYWYVGASGTAGNAISFTQAMTLDASGNLLLGTTSGTSKFTISGSNNPIQMLNSGGANQSDIDFLDAQTLRIRTYHASGSAISFATNSNGGGNTERARIDSSGRLLVGTTSALVNESSFGASSSGNTATFKTTGGAGVSAILVWNSGTSGTRDLIQFSTGASYSALGSINTNGSTITYGGTSDYRLKENIAPMTGALAAVSQLKPCTFTWKNTGIEDNGFIAHELAEVCPNAVVGEKDAVNEDGSIKAQQIDTSFLVATLTAAIQELKAIVDAQAAEIAALKG